MTTIVAVGAGHAGFQLALSLRQEGSDARVVLLGDERPLPYQRPPLSKTYLDESQTLDLLAFRPGTFFKQNAIEWIGGTRVAALDRADGTLALADGSRIPFDHLVLATGARNRPLLVPGTHLDGVIGIRTLDDSEDLRRRLKGIGPIVVIGAGFIGLEIAAVLAKRGHKVTVIEAMDRPMKRAVSPEISFHHARVLGELGVHFLFGTGVTRIFGEGGSVTGVETRDGVRLSAELIVVGIGVLPNAELAAAAGLPVSNGIVTDALMRTQDPRIFAIGDVAMHPNPHAGGPVRIESVQNATDQARLVAAQLAGKPVRPYAAVPWFWSDQGPIKLQIAGLPIGADRHVLRGDPASGSFSVFLYRGARLLAVESVSRAADHMMARRLLAGGAAPTPEQAGDLSVDLRAFITPRRNG